MPWDQPTRAFLALIIVVGTGAVFALTWAWRRRRQASVRQRYGPRRRPGEGIDIT